LKVINRRQFDAILEALSVDGFMLVGPTIRDQAVVYDEIHSTADLPIGWTDRQNPGSYRLERRADEALFGYVVGPQSWKKYLFPPVQKLFHVTREGLAIQCPPAETAKRAFIGVRACEIHAMALQDQVFTRGPYTDRGYQSQRENVFILAVNCGEPASTCFCTSMGTGPEVKGNGFDLALTEVLQGGRHEFIVETGTPRGEKYIQTAGFREAAPEDRQHRRDVVGQAVQRMGRSMQAHDVKELLERNYNHPRWEEVAQRCLSCANCTMVCPTCFCSTVEDTTDLTGDHAERWRKWDSCFTMDFSFLAGSSIRSSTKARYRQWMTHKLATWHDQFGASGCVGCGRCITWCPVGIDITEEVAAIRETEVRLGTKDASREC
jgi:ferredoxin